MRRSEVTAEPAPPPRARGASAARRAVPAIACGTAAIAGHHGEIVQGIFSGPDGRIHRGLVTLRCPLFASRATFVPDTAPARDAGRPRAVTVRPVTKAKALRAAELTLEHLGCAVGGTLTVDTSAVEGWGLGSSTSDVTAAIIAVGRALGVNVPASEVARLAVAAERAVDSLMFDGDAVLFAHREGVVLERFAKSLPPLAVIGLNPVPDAPGVDTLAFPPASYPLTDVRVFEELRARLRRAIAAQDARLIGEVATASAIINQRYLAVPRFDTLLSIAASTGAVGVQVAHSGRVAGLLFDATSASSDEATARAEAFLAETMPGHVHWRFSTDADRSPTLQEVP